MVAMRGTMVIVKSIVASTKGYNQGCHFRMLDIEIMFMQFRSYYVVSSCYVYIHHGFSPDRKSSSVHGSNSTFPVSSSVKTFASFNELGAGPLITDPFES